MRSKRGQRSLKCGAAKIHFLENGKTIGEIMPLSSSETCFCALQNMSLESRAMFQRSLLFSLSHTHSCKVDPGSNGNLADVIVVVDFTLPLHNKNKSRARNFVGGHFGTESAFVIHWSLLTLNLTLGSRSHENIVDRIVSG